jgi:hypothetical protein
LINNLDAIAIPNLTMVSPDWTLFSLTSKRGKKQGHLDF